MARAVSALPAPQNPRQSCALALFPGVWARWGGGEAASRVADSFLLSCSTLFAGRASRLFQLPSPLQKKRKIHGKSAFLLPPSLTIRDVSPVTGVSEKQNGPFRVLGRLEAVALTQRDIHCAAFRSPLS